MKGFWRAVRRGEKWAVRINNMEGMTRLLGLSWMHIDWDAELKKPSFLDKYFKKEDQWVGGLFIVPFAYVSKPSFQAILTRIRTRRHNPGPRRKRK